MRGIINYSMEVVTLSQSSKSGPEQAQALAEYVEEVINLSAEQKEVPLKVSKKSINEILNDIRAQEDLLAALRAAQPIIDEVGRVAADFIDEYKDTFYAALDAVTATIDEEYRPLLLYQKTIRAQQDFVVNAYEALYEYAYADEKRKQEILQLFIEAKPTTATFDNVTLEDGLTPQELWKVEEVLLKRMERIFFQRASTEPELEIYIKKRDELDGVCAQGDAAIVKARAAIFVWVRVHRRMFKGIVHPADINLWEVTKKVVNSAPLPFPF